MVGLTTLTDAVDFINIDTTATAATSNGNIVGVNINVANNTK